MDGFYTDVEEAPDTGRSQHKVENHGRDEFGPERHTLSLLLPLRMIDKTRTKPSFPQSVAQHRGKRFYLSP